MGPLSLTALATSLISCFGNTVRMWWLELQEPSWDHEVQIHASHPQPSLGSETTVRWAQCMLPVMLHLPRYVHNYSFRSHTVSSRETYTSINSYWSLQAEHWGKDVNEAVMFWRSSQCLNKISFGCKCQKPNFTVVLWALDETRNKFKIPSMVLIVLV